jgi:hypothetical protein
LLRFASPFLRKKKETAPCFFSGGFSSIQYAVAERLRLTFLFFRYYAPGVAPHSWLRSVVVPPPTLPPQGFISVAAPPLRHISSFVVIGSRGILRLSLSAPQKKAPYPLRYSVTFFVLLFF